MNRTALTIKMLNYLKAHDLVSREELSQYLETNIRNISEFKKELETAGYKIDSVSGKHGGYRLDETSLIPMLALNDKEIMALNDTRQYLKAQGFKYYESFSDALIKIKGNLREPLKSSEVHFLNGNIMLSNEDQNLSEKIKEAKHLNCVVHMEYKKLNSNVWEQRTIQPYEFIHTEDGDYILAYDVTLHKEHAFKHFKMSVARMRNVEAGKQTFTRDYDFKIENHIGKQGLFKDVIEVTLEIRGHYATLLYEKKIGLFASKKLKNNILYITFTVESRMWIVEFILSLGEYCKIITPETIKKEVIEKLRLSLNQYVV